MASTPVRQVTLSMCARPARLAAAAGLAASLSAAAPAALIVSTWAAANSGVWSDAARWSPSANAPNNGVPSGDTYHAIINTVGGAYTVTLNSSVSLDMLTLNSANATIDHTSGNFNPGTANLQAGLFRLSGGTVSGGVWNLTGGGFQLTTSGGTLSNTTINGDLIASANSARAILSGAVAFDALRLQNANISIGFAPGASFSGDIVAEGAAFGQRNIEMNGLNGALAINADGAVRLAAGSGGDLNLGGGFTFGGSMTLTNNGTIEANAAGRTLTVQPQGGLTNNGLLRVTDGALTYAGAASWTNNGTVEVSGGTLNLGNFNVASGIGAWNRTGGTVNMTGTVNNAAHTITLNSSTGSWNLAGGTLSGGTVNFANGASIGLTTSGGTISGATINGDLIASANSARAILSGAVAFDALRLQNANISIGFAPGASFSGDIVAEGAAFGQRNIEMNGLNGALAINADGAVRLAAGSGGDLNLGGGFTFGGSMTLTNNGTIEASAAGRTLFVQPGGSFTNNGLIRASAGTISIDRGGTAPWVNNGDAIAGPGGTLRFADGYDAANSTGDLRVEIAGALTQNYGKINITAPTTINGSDIGLDFINGFSPDWGDKFTILTFDAGEVTGDFSSFVLPALADAVNWRWYTEVTTTSVAVGVRHTSDVNRDNQINFADLNIIVSNFNTPGGPTMGDVNEDGFVGFADLNRVISFFNTSAPVNSVPAPAGSVLLAGLLAAASRRRR